jgi:hypothetical protein
MIVQTLWMFAIAAGVALAVAALIKGLVALLAHAAPRPAPASADPPLPAAVAPPPPAHIAAISAAVYTLLGPHRIVRLQAAESGRGWAGAGRFAQHRSHTPRPPARRH